MTDQQLHKILITPYWSGMPEQKSIDYYLNLERKPFSGRGARLKNNLREYWNNLVKERYPRAVEMAKHRCWFDHYSVSALMAKLSETFIDNVTKPHIFSWPVQDRY